MKKIIESILQAFEKVDLRILIFLILSFRSLSFTLTGNEEQYFAYAKLFFNPSWIENSFSFSEPVGARFLFQYIAGFLLYLFDFEQVAFVGRLLNFALFAFPLAKLFRRFQFSNLATASILILFYLPHQTFFANEWIFKGFEAKTLAYVFVFYSIYFLAEQKFYKSILFAAFAAYFHILVGGWFAIGVFVYLLINQLVIRKIFTLGVFFIILNLPLLVFLFLNLKLGEPTVIEGVNTNWIYVYFRNPHHIAPFLSWAYFVRYFLVGVMVSFAFFLLCLTYFKKLKNANIQILNNLNIAFFSIQFLMLLLAYFDKNGDILKYYPFRTSALSIFFIFMELALILKYWYNKQKWSVSRKLIVPSIFFVLSLAYFSVKANNTINLVISYLQAPQEAQLTAVAYWAKENSKPDDVFLLLDAPHFEDLSFVRKAERERFVAFKFIPTTKTKMYNWYMRLQEKERVQKDISYLFKLKKIHRLNYLISRKPILNGGLRLVYTNQKYYLYLIE